MILNEWDFCTKYFPQNLQLLSSFKILVTILQYVDMTRLGIYHAIVNSAEFTVF